MAQEKEVDLSKKHIKLSLRTKIIWLVVLLIILIMTFVYQTIIRDETKALNSLMVSGGSALSRLLANNSRILLTSALAEAALDGDITEKTYERIDYFDLGFSETLDEVIKQDDIVYAFILNRYGKYVAASDKNIMENSEFEPFAGISLYKDMYTDGDPIIALSQSNLEPWHDEASGRSLKASYLLDISFPMVVNTDNKSLSAYEGEVHIGFSREQIKKTIRAAEAKLQGVSFLAFILGLIGSIVLALIIINPIKRLVQAMGKVAEGDLKQKVNVKTKDEIELLAVSFNKMTDGMSKYVSPGLVKKLMKNPESLSLGGGAKNITMFFSDIRNFTGTSEKMTPHDVVTYLNEYLDIMTKVVLKYNGEVDKYVGDEIMALYGAFEQDDSNLAEHTRNAVRTAVEMNQALIPFNERRQEQGLVQIRAGIGINTGHVILGNMGSTERMDYTVIGDNVNLAARLCDNAGKDYREENGNVIHLRNILITEETYNMVKDIVVVDDKVIYIHVKGKEKPVKIFQVYDIRE